MERRVWGVQVTSAVQHAATAARLRAEADFTELIAGVLFGAVSLLDAAESLRGVANGKRAAAEMLDEMAHEQPAEKCVCCTHDCGDRRGHVQVVRIVDMLGVPAYEVAECNRGRDWPCELAS